MRDFGLVVIGAHTGQYLREIISEYTDKNILLVEPVPYNYMVLEKEYSNKENFFICKNAILDNSSKQIFFYVKKESVKKLGKHWATGIGSFDKNHILSHKGKRFNITDEDIQKVQGTVSSWRTGEGYEDIEGYCKSSTTEEIEENGFVLTPGRYVGFADEEDDGVPFEEKLSQLSSTYYQMQEESIKLDKKIKTNLAKIRNE